MGASERERETESQREITCEILTLNVVSNVDVVTMATSKTSPSRLYAATNAHSLVIYEYAPGNFTAIATIQLPQLSRSCEKFCRIFTASFAPLYSFFFGFFSVVYFCFLANFRCPCFSSTHYFFPSYFFLASYVPFFPFFPCSFNYLHSPTLR